MTTPLIKVKVFPKPVLKGKMDVRFPAYVAANSFLTVTQSNGTYTFGVDYSLLDPGPISNPATALVAVQDQASGVYRAVSVASLLTAGIDPELAAIAALTSAADKLPYFTGSGTAALADFSAFARSLLDDTTQGAMQTTLGLVPGTNVQAFDADLSSLAAASSTNAIYYRSAANTWSPVSIGTNITFSGGVLSASSAGIVDEVRRNIILNGVRAAKSLGAVQPIVNGIAEGFGGNDGINAGASSNYSLDTTNKRVINSVTTPGETMISAGAGTTQTDQFTTRTSASFDGNTAQAVGVCTDGPNLVNIGRLGKDFGAGNAKVITGMTAYSSTDGGFLNSLTTCNLVLKASNTDPTTTSWTGTTIGTIAGFTNANSAFTKSTLGNANTTAYRYAWLEMSGTNTRWLSELQFFETVPPTINNMTVVENGYADLDFVPSTLQVSAVLEPVDAATLNTDATMEVSRDNGTTWTAASLVQYHTLGTKTFVESAAISVTGQPSGTKPCFRYKTFNNKRVYLHGASIAAVA